MKFFVFTIILSLGAAITSASPTPPPPTVDLSKVYIENIAYAGSGCPMGSIALLKTEDWTLMTILFDQYIASIGPGVPITENRKNCNLNILLHYPVGLQFTMYQTNYSGFASLEDGVRAIQQSDYWFAGFPLLKTTFKTTMVGPFSDAYSRSDQLSDTKLVLSPCGASTTLNIDTQVFLDNSANRNGSGLIDVEVIDHKATTTFHLLWSPC